MRRSRGARSAPARLAAWGALIALAATARAGMVEYHFDDTGAEPELKVTAPDSYKNQEIFCTIDADGVRSCEFTADVTGLDIPNQSLIAFLRQPNTGANFPVAAQVGVIVRYFKGPSFDVDGNEIEFLSVLFEARRIPPLTDRLDFLAEDSLIINGEEQEVMTFFDTVRFNHPVESPPSTDSFFVRARPVPEPSGLALLGLGGLGLLTVGRRGRRREAP